MGVAECVDGLLTLTSLLELVAADSGDREEVVFGDEESAARGSFAVKDMGRQVHFAAQKVYEAHTDSAARRDGLDHARCDAKAYRDIVMGALYAGANDIGKVKEGLTLLCRVAFG